MFPALIAFFGTFQSTDFGLMPRLNQTVFAAPMIGLYLVSILIVWAVQPKRK